MLVTDVGQKSKDFSKDFVTSISILSATTDCYLFYSGHMKEMIENFNRYQIINESTGNVIKVSHLCWLIKIHVVSNADSVLSHRLHMTHVTWVMWHERNFQIETDILDEKCKRLQFHLCKDKNVRILVIQRQQVWLYFLTHSHESSLMLITHWYDTLWFFLF